jgi:hypothetical protein
MMVMVMVMMMVVVVMPEPMGVRMIRRIGDRLHLRHRQAG